MNIFDMKQERAQVVQNLRDLMDKYDGKEMDGADKSTLANLEAEFDRLNDSIMAEEKQLERERVVGEKAPEAAKGASHKRETFAKILTGDKNSLESFRNDYVLGTEATAGALTAPMEFREELIKGLDDYMFMRQIARNVGTIGNAQSLGFPFRATAAADAQWVGEVAAAPEETQLTYGRREFKPNRMAKLIKLSRTLVNHAAMAERTVRDEMLYRIAVTAENAYLNGDGSGKPLGIFTASNNGISTARDIDEGNTATAITFDGLMNAKYALKEQYMRNADWVMHRDAAKQIALIKDNEDQYIWMPSVRDGQPDYLLGHRVHMSEFAPNTFTTGKYVAVFGDFNYYWIADGDGLEVQVLTELYAPNNQIGYLFNYFGDGAPVVEEAFARVALG